MREDILAVDEDETSGGVVRVAASFGPKLIYPYSIELEAHNSRVLVCLTHAGAIQLAKAILEML